MTRTNVLVGVLLPLVLASLALACRYTVRDIGFVRLGGEPLRLVVLSSAAVDGIRAALTDLPVEIITVDPEHDPNHPGVLAAEELKTNAVLLDSSGRSFAVKDPLVIGHGPIAQELAAEASSTFAHVLLLETGNQSKDAVARAECNRLQSSLDAIEKHLPRPLGHPLKIMTLEPQQQEREDALLWSLGINAPVREPTVVVLYGRARRAGEPVVLTEETRINGSRELLAQLALVGESCECDTSRAWTEEPVGLIPWSRETHAIASKSLGFDPENPIVRNEVVRILGRAPSDRGDEKPVPDSLEELLLGYGETTLTPIDPAEPTEAEPRETAQPPVQVVRGNADDDWSFDEPAKVPPQIQTPMPAQEEPKAAQAAQAGLISLYGLLILIGVLLGFGFIVTGVVLRRTGASP